MLKDIKSLYFTKLIFIHINERLKLKFIKYNKSLQKHLNINIKNYQHFIGNYIIYESNGIVKEYNGYDDSLIFEVKYLHFQKNGKGIEYYYNGKLKFEGEYLNGSRNGKGKEYNIIGTLIFEGEYLNGTRNGKGKEYYNDGNLRFEGEYLNNKKIFGIKYIIDDGLITKIDYNIKNNDEDILIIFECDDLNWKGKRLNIYEQSVLRSAYLNYHIRTGKKFKSYYLNNKLIYKGEYLNGKKHGKGKEYYEDNYEDNKLILIFEGEYLYDFKIEGKLYLNEKLEFEGEFLFNKKWNGKGYDENGNIIYELINGNGKVKEYSFSGKIIFEGEYLNGKKI